MLACSFIVLLSTGALGALDTTSETSVRPIGQRFAAASRSTAKRQLPSPTLELKRSTETLRKTLARRYPGWSPEAEAQAASVQTVIDALLDFEEISRRTLGTHWDRMAADQKRDFIDVLQKLIERKPLDRSLQVDLESNVVYRGETVVDDEAKVSSLVTSYATGRPSRRSVDYKLCFRNGHWRVYDVIVENVSLVDDYRDQFSRIIAQDGVDGLMKRMRKKVGGDAQD
jgi:phospholipid transport system substrate-binding protein